MTLTLALVLAAIAAVLAIVALWQSQGRSFVAWGVLALAAIHLLEVLA